VGEDEIIKEHLAWLNGELPSQKEIEKDFSEAPIYHFYHGRKDPLLKLWNLILALPPKHHKRALDELSKLLRFIKE